MATFLCYHKRVFFCFFLLNHANMKGSETEPSSSRQFAPPPAMCFSLGVRSLTPAGVQRAFLFFFPFSTSFKLIPDPWRLIWHTRQLPSVCVCNTGVSLSPRELAKPGENLPRKKKLSISSKCRQFGLLSKCLCSDRDALSLLLPLHLAAALPGVEFTAPPRSTPLHTPGGLVLHIMSF